MSNDLVYLDHNATTPLAPEVRAALPGLLAHWGNPSSIHAASREPKKILRETRRDLAEMLNCSPLELVFTSGGSESNTTVLRAVWEELGKSKPHFICSAIEHPSVLRGFEWLESQGAEVDRVPVDRQGNLDLKFLETKITGRTALVSVMSANNETGTLLPVREVVKLARAKGALVHTDAVQMFGKLPLDLESLGVDYASISAHKFYALKGAGALFVRKGRPYRPLIFGGGQERHRRGGTENIAGIAALGISIAGRGSIPAQAERIGRLRDHFEARVLEEIAGVTVTASETSRLPNTSSLVLRGVDGETLLMSLDLKGFAVSTGAACSSGNPEPSPVLLAIGLTRDEAQNSLRVSLGWGNTLEEIDSFVEALKQVTTRLRSLQGNSDPAGSSAEVRHGS